MKRDELRERLDLIVKQLWSTMHTIAYVDRIEDLPEYLDEEVPAGDLELQIANLEQHAAELDRVAELAIKIAAANLKAGTL